MKQNKFSELVFSEDDICDLLMQGHTVDSLKHVRVDETVDLDAVNITTVMYGSIDLTKTD